jgi:hypothetical protein
MTREHLLNVTKLLGERKTNLMPHEQAVHVSSAISILSSLQYIDDAHRRDKESACHLTVKLWPHLIHIIASLGDELCQYMYICRCIFMYNCQ